MRYYSVWVETQDVAEETGRRKVRRYVIPDKVAGGNPASRACIVEWVLTSTAMVPGRYRLLMRRIDGHGEFVEGDWDGDHFVADDDLSDIPSNSPSWGELRFQGGLEYAACQSPRTTELLDELPPRGPIRPADEPTLFEGDAS